MAPAVVAPGSSVGGAWSRRPARSSVPVTRPAAGSMRTIVSVSQALAQTIPSTHSSSLRRMSASPAGSMRTLPITSNVVGVAEGEAVAAVAHDQPLPVEAETPALPLVVESAQCLEGGGVPGVGHALLPRELDEPVAHQGQPFTELLVRQWRRAQHGPGLRVHLADGRSAPQPGRLVEPAVVVQLQALGPGRGVVRAARDDLPVERWRSRRRRGRRWQRREPEGEGHGHRHADDEGTRRASREKCASPWPEGVARRPLACLSGTGAALEARPERPAGAASCQRRCPSQSYGVQPTAAPQSTRDPTAPLRGRRQDGASVLRRLERSPLLGDTGAAAEGGGSRWSGGQAGQSGHRGRVPTR